LAAPRAVRIPRAGPRATSPAAASSTPEAPPTPARAPTGEIRRNQAANERARRLLLLYLGTLVVLYVAFLVADRAAPGGTSSAANTGMLFFSVIAVVLAAGGIWIALGPVPRYFTLLPDALVVVEAWGRRRRFPPLDEVRAYSVRRFPRSFLNSRAVETVEVTDVDGHRRTYQVEEGVLPIVNPETRPGARLLQ